MKTKLTLFVTVLAATLFATGCATTQTQEEKVVGSYTYEYGGAENMFVFSDTGSCKRYVNGKETTAYKWKVIDSEVHIERPDGYVGIWVILPNGNHMLIAEKPNGNRVDVPRERRYISKKIK